MVGMHIALKNFSLYKEYRTKKASAIVSRWEKLGLWIVPIFCFIGGSINLYLAVDILRDYRQEREIWHTLNEEGIFAGKSED